MNKHTRLRCGYENIYFVFPTTHIFGSSIIQLLTDRFGCLRIVFLFIEIVFVSWFHSVTTFFPIEHDGRAKRLGGARWAIFNDVGNHRRSFVHITLRANRILFKVHRPFCESNKHSLWVLRTPAVNRLRPRKTIPLIGICHSDFSLLDTDNACRV